MSKVNSILRVDAVESHAFDAVYSPDGDHVASEYAYGCIHFSDRNGRKYWWATSEDTKSLESLKPGQFIKASYQFRDLLPGDEQNWFDGSEPDGESIFYLEWRYAPATERWGIPSRQRKSRVSGNIAKAIREARGK